MANRTSDPSAPEGVTLSGADLDRWRRELRRVSFTLDQAAKALNSLINEGTAPPIPGRVTRRASASFSAHVRWHVQRHKLKAGCSFCAALQP